MGPNQILGLIAVIIIVGREFIINGIRLVASDGGLVIAASMWGKIKTAVTMVSICLMIVVDEIPCLKEVSLVVFWVAVTLTVVSLVDYICKNASIMCDFNVVGDKKDAGKKDASNAVEAKQEFKPKFDEETDYQGEEFELFQIEKFAKKRGYNSEYFSYEDKQKLKAALYRKGFSQELINKAII